MRVLLTGSVRRLAWPCVLYMVQFLRTPQHSPGKPAAPLERGRISGRWPGAQG